MVLGFWGAKNIRIYGVFCSESLKKTWKHRLFDDFWPLWDWEKNCRGNSRHHKQHNDSKHLSLIFFFIVFCVFSVVTYFAPIRFYKQTTLRTETFAQSSFYVQILLHRKVCAQINFYTQTPLHTEVFTQRSLPTEVFIHRCFAQRCIYTHRDRHTGTFTHRTFYTEKPLHRTVFTQRNFYTGKLWHRTICPHRLHKEVFTHRNFYTQKLYPEQLLHTEFFPHRSLSAQKSLCTAFFTQGPFTHRCLYSLYTEKLLHTETSAQSTLLHTASFYTERLCFPFLITCLSCSPLRYCCM